MQELQGITTTDAERKTRLKHLEGVVRHGIQTFIEVGAALLEIRDGRLSEPAHKDFEAYCQAEFGWTQRNADRNIRSAKTAAKLRPIGLGIENEAQAREMDRIVDDPDAAMRVWEKVGNDNNGDHPARAIKGAVDRDLGLVPLPASLDSNEGSEVLEKYSEVRAGEHGEYINPDVMKRATSNRGKRVHNETDKQERIANLPDLKHTGVEGIEVHNCDFNDLDIEDKSVNLVLTDPPWDKGSLHLFDALGVFAERVLKPDGFLVAYTGTDNSFEATKRVAEHVPWWWQIIVTHEDKDMSFDRRFIRDYKPIQIFGWIQDRIKNQMMTSLREGKGGDKDHHPWGQPVEEAIKLIKEMTEPGELVVDPFAGGGTVPVAAMRTERRCIAAEKDVNHHKVAINRVTDESKIRRREYSIPAAPGYVPPSREERIRTVLEGLGSSVIVLQPQPLPERRTL